MTNGIAVARSASTASWGQFFRAESTNEFVDIFFCSREYETNRHMDSAHLVGEHTNTPKISFKGPRTFVLEVDVLDELYANWDWKHKKRVNNDNM